MTGSDISASLRDLADRRTDIFGVEETAIGKKVGETEKDQASNVVLVYLKKVMFDISLNCLIVVKILTAIVIY